MAPLAQALEAPALRAPAQAPALQAPALQAPAPQALQAPYAPHSRVQLEELLRAKKLDRTLTTALPGGLGDEALAPFAIAALDTRLLGGLPRGHLSELVGAPSSGRTSLAWAWLAAATARGETVALVDTFDRFDPPSGVACGIDLTRLLWVRGQALSKTGGAVDPAWLPGARTVEGPGTLLERTIDRALKALNLVLQSRVCTAVVLDMADVPVQGLRRIPMTTWLRVQRVIEGSDTACLLMAPIPLARSAGGVTIATGATGASGAPGATGSVRPASPKLAAKDCASEGGCTSAAGAAGAAGAVRRGTGAQVRWAGTHDRARRLSGLTISTRLSSPRRTMTGEVTVDAIAREA